MPCPVPYSASRTCSAARSSAGIPSSRSFWRYCCTHWRQAAERSCRREGRCGSRWVGGWVSVGQEQAQQSAYERVVGRTREERPSGQVGGTGAAKHIIIQQRSKPSIVQRSAAQQGGCPPRPGGPAPRQELAAGPPLRQPSRCQRGGYCSGCGTCWCSRLQQGAGNRGERRQLIKERWGHDRRGDGSWPGGQVAVPMAEHKHSSSGRISIGSTSSSTISTTHLSLRTSASSGAPPPRCCTAADPAWRPPRCCRPARQAGRQVKALHLS